MTEVVAGSPPDDVARLSRATIGMTAGTLLSRVTGFGRIVALAYALGLGSRARLADTYNLANTTPNIVYDLLLGGILSAFIVPVFVGGGPDAMALSARLLDHGIFVPAIRPPSVPRTA